MGGCCLFVPGSKLNKKKIKKKIFVALDGRRPKKTHNYQLKTRGRDKRGIGQDARPAGSTGGAQFDCYGDVQVEREG